MNGSRNMSSEQECKITIRECVDTEDLSDCVRLQREVFALPELEISPVRHFIVTLHAGGFTLGAFYGGELIGFTLSVPAVLRGEKAFYSHMTVVDKNFQSMGIGRKLKWEQRRTALKRDVKFIKWTFQPVVARNAYFNLEKLGAEIREYEPNFYGTDYGVSPSNTNSNGIDSDRLFAEWQLESKKVKALANGDKFEGIGESVRKIEIPNDWHKLLETDANKAIAEQKRIKQEFQTAFSENLICRSFERDKNNPKYLLFSR